jgi:hypothetical protein
MSAVLGHPELLHGAVTIGTNNRYKEALLTDLGQASVHPETLLRVQDRFGNLHAFVHSAGIFADGRDVDEVPALTDEPTPCALIGWLTEAISATQATVVWIGSRSVRGILQARWGSKDATSHLDELLAALFQVATQTRCAVVVEKPDEEQAVVL